jgi:hypothetical protein
VPYQPKSNRANYDSEFEWLLCLASRLQTSQRLRPAEIRGIKKPGELPMRTMTRSLEANPRGYAILNGRYANHKATKRASLPP